MMLALALLGCGREPSLGGEPEASTISAYHGLEAGASWIYRDDQEEAEPDESTLLRAQLDGDTLALRRGVRWADASAVGSLSWDASDGLTLVGWQLPSGDSGSGSVRITDEYIDSGEGCALSVPEDGHETYHGRFEDVLVFDCDGDLPGRFVFALGIGLVWLEAPDDTLDLVAPW